MKADLIGLHADELGSDELPAVATNGSIPGAYPNIIQRSTMRRASPQPRGAVAQVARTGSDDTYEKDTASEADRERHQ